MHKYVRISCMHSPTDYTEWWRGRGEKEAESDGNEEKVKQEIKKIETLESERRYHDV
jgi:hypothetical protein